MIVDITAETSVAARSNLGSVKRIDINKGLSVSPPMTITITIVSYSRKQSFIFSTTHNLHNIPSQKPSPACKASYIGVGVGVGIKDNYVGNIYMYT